MKKTQLSTLPQVEGVTCVRHPGHLVGSVDLGASVPFFVVTPFSGLHRLMHWPVLFIAGFCVATVEDWHFVTWKYLKHDADELWRTTHALWEEFVQYCAAQSIELEVIGSGSGLSFYWPVGNAFKKVEGALRWEYRPEVHELQTRFVALAAGIRSRRERASTEGRSAEC